MIYIVFKDEGVNAALHTVISRGKTHVDNMETLICQ